MPDNILFAFGLYPDQAERFNSSMEKEFNKLCIKLKPSALGEVGLDYYWNYGEKYLQEKLFRNQIELSVRLGLPLIIHSRDSYEDTYRILSEYKFQKPVILHCFSYGMKEAERFLNLGFILSFAGNLTYPSADQLQKAALMAPLDSMLLETDSPYLSPVPVRGRKNSPVNVKYTYQFLTKLRNMDEMDLILKIEKNFKNIFHPLNV